METVEQLPPSQEKFVCLSVFNLIFLYIYFTTELNVWPSTWCTCFCVNAADAFPCSLQNVKMFNVTMLSLCRDSSFVFEGEGGMEWTTISIMLTKTTTSVETGMTIPVFPQFLSTRMLVCLRTGCLFIAPEKYAKGAKQYRETYERGGQDVWETVFILTLNVWWGLTITSSHKPKGQKLVLLPSAAPSHPTHCCLLNAAVRFSSRQSPDYKSVCRTCLPAAQSPDPGLPRPSFFRLHPSSYGFDSLSFRKVTEKCPVLSFLICSPLTCFPQRVEGRRPGC